MSITERNSFEETVLLTCCWLLGVLVRYSKDSAFRRSGGLVCLQWYRTVWFRRSQNCNFTLTVTTEARHGPHQGLFSCFLVVRFFLWCFNAVGLWLEGIKPVKKTCCISPKSSTLGTRPNLEELCKSRLVKQKRKVVVAISCHALYI